MSDTLRRHGGNDYTNPSSADIRFIDNIAPMLDRAAAIADLLHAVEDADAAIMDETRKHACSAIRCEMDDARAELNAWWDANRAAYTAAAKEKAEAEAKRLEDPKERMRDALDYILAKEFPDPVKCAAEIERRFAREEAKKTKAAKKVKRAKGRQS